MISPQKPRVRQQQQRISPVGRKEENGEEDGHESDGGVPNGDLGNLGRGRPTRHHPHGTPPAETISSGKRPGRGNRPQHARGGTRDGEDEDTETSPAGRGRPRGSSKTRSRDRTGGRAAEEEDDEEEGEEEEEEEEEKGRRRSGRMARRNSHPGQVCCDKGTPELRICAYMRMQGASWLVRI